MRFFWLVDSPPSSQVDWSAIHGFGPGVFPKIGIRFFRWHGDFRSPWFGSWFWVVVNPKEFLLKKSWLLRDKPLEKCCVITCVSLFGLVQLSFQGTQDENVNQQTMHDNATCRNRHNFNLVLRSQCRRFQNFGCWDLERHVISSSLQQNNYNWLMWIN